MTRLMSTGLVRSCATGPVLLLLAVAVPASAQSDELNIGLEARGVLTRVDPVPGGGTRTEARLVHPVLMVEGHSLDGYLSLHAMANFEGAVLPGGELSPGAWGEGFVDRRHPHTYVHELMVSAWQPLGPTDVSLSLGKGFAPFGTDDPLVRPIQRYPVNHHLSQILERAVAIAAVRSGPVTVEAGLFNGDEPEKPDGWPNLRRFGDSWTGRVTLIPAAGLELQGSYAHVVSPEHRPGQGPPVRKWNVSGRVERAMGGGRLYLLGEWAETREAGGAFVYPSLLGEGSWKRGRATVAYRFERTARPEEIRLLDPFRSARPHLDNSIVGRTRFALHTFHLEAAVVDDAPKLVLSTFGELTAGRVTSLTPVSFDPDLFYGKSSVLTMTVGVRIGFGMRLHRMGRYGVAAAVGVRDADNDVNRMHGVH